MKINFWKLNVENKIIGMAYCNWITQEFFWVKSEVHDLRVKKPRITVEM